MEKENKKIIIPEMFQINAPESDYLFVEPSQIPNSGSGLFTAIPIYKGEIISVFEGEILSDQESKNRAEKGLDGYFINLLDGSIMDSRNVDCFAKYANDSQGLVKSKFKNNSLITLDDEDRVCIVATKAIKSGAEIFCDYGSGYWEKHKLDG